MPQLNREELSMTVEAIGMIRERMAPARVTLERLSDRTESSSVANALELMQQADNILRDIATKSSRRLNTSSLEVFDGVE